MEIWMLFLPYSLNCIHYKVSSITLILKRYNNIQLFPALILNLKTMEKRIKHISNIEYIVIIN